MAPGEEAASSLVQAYIGSADAAADVASYFGKSSVVSGCSAGSVAHPGPIAPTVHGAQLQLSTQPSNASQTSRRVGPPGSTPAIRSARGTRPRLPSAGCILSARHSSAGSMMSGNWAPEMNPPRCTVSSDGAAVALVDRQTLQDTMRIMAQCLQDGGMPQPGLLSLAAQVANDKRMRDAFAAGDLGSSAKSCTGSQTCCEGQDCASQLSHATTPSWRSRSFPANVVLRRREVQKSKASNAHLDLSAKTRRLPALPEEARPQNRCPPSEVAHLSEIASDVHEANALLVESFLNVKRRPMSRYGPTSTTTSTAASSCSAEERQSSRHSSKALLSSRPPRLGRKYEVELGTLPEASESCARSGSTSVLLNLASPHVMNIACF